MQDHELAPYALFAALSKQERETVGRYLDRVDVKAGRTLAQEGAFAHEFFVIESGEATVTRERAGLRVGPRWTKERGEETLRTLGPGDFFGEIALVETDRRTATVTAVTDMRLLVMHERDFRSMLEQAPPVAERLQAAMRERSGR